MQEDVIFLNGGGAGAKEMLAALPSASPIGSTAGVSPGAGGSELAAAAAGTEEEDGVMEKDDEEVAADVEAGLDGGGDDDEDEDEQIGDVRGIVASAASPPPVSRHQQLALTTERVVLKFLMPWSEVVSELSDTVKSMTAGYASLDWMPGGYVRADIVKVDILMNSKPVDALSFVAHRDKALGEARRVALKLKGAIARQMFEISIQAAIGSKIVAKERIAPFRKDVLIKSGKLVGGGDKSRKEKLLSKQRAGKKRMKTVGNIELPQSAFLAIMSSK